MKYIFFFFVSLSAIAQNIPTCPSESILIEFVSPITKGKKSFCGYLKNGETVKHGEEFIFNASGELQKKLVYNHGKEGEEPQAAAPAFGGKNIPGTEEASIGAKPKNEEEKLLATLQELLGILTLKKVDMGNGRFKVSKCDPNSSTWVRGAIMKTPINKTYKFQDLCDVQGSFSANFQKEFPVSFELRNLQDYNKTDMTVTMEVSRVTSGILYKYKVLEGSISSPTSNANFKAEYEVELDPLKGKIFKNTQKGQLTVMKINGKEVSASVPLKFDE